MTDAVVRFGDAAAVNGVTARVDDGAVLGIVGPNGSGKTTLLRVMCGLQPIDAGEVRVDDVRWGSSSKRPVGALGRSVALVAQNHESQGQLRVIESVMLGRLALRGAWSPFSAEDWDVAAEALRSVGAMHLVEREVGTLSGGERQRVSVARALTQATSHMLLDEPTNHLDVRYQHDLLDLVRGLGITIVVVLHDLNLAGRYCDRLVVLERGSVVAEGAPRDVLDPDLIESVYHIPVARHDWRGNPHLYFAPDESADAG
ncbi:ABC transporter ATP-binding protein [Microbacterium sp.]|uniref:ABC transporter ATP-binding protein n=1 Tax=Microbacterium sp. TaxID=51671 RepID=UPI0032213C7E